MSKHEKTFVNLDKPYEQNLIGLRGIIIFGDCLFLLCVVTFGLMFFLQNVLEDQAKETDRINQNPMTKGMTGKDFLPPEPRLQSAPGFGVDSENGRVNLELRNPQAEYDELHKQWEKLWKDGQKDAKTGTVVTLPMDEAKKKLLEQNPKAVSAEQGQKSLEEATTFVSGSSAGRTTSDRRR